MRRREFFGVVGCTALVWSPVVRAQQAAAPVVGLLSGIRLNARQRAAVTEGLKDEGYSEGSNVIIEDHWAEEGQPDYLRAQAAELVRRPVAVIVTVFGTGTALAAKGATSTIPIVFALGGDPVKIGLAESLNHPGGNATGVSFLVNSLGSKRFELLRDMMPQITAAGFLVNSANPNTPADIEDARVAAARMGLDLNVQDAKSELDIENAFANFAEHGIKAIIVAADAFLFSQRNRLFGLATRHSIAAGYSVREYVTDGGLMSYGTSLTDAFRLAGRYAGRVLKGEKPADLPIVQSVKFELVINLKTARSLGLSIPQSLLATADEVIE
jgi:putative tryptophan/tyrosine transport system substrate-binding protein